MIILALKLLWRKNKFFNSNLNNTGERRQICCLECIRKLRWLFKKWRDDSIGKKVIEYVKQNREYVRNDQDGLNAVLAGQWGELHPKWNLMPKVYDYPSWQDSPFAQEVYNELVHNPCIIHYTNSPKPWFAGLKAECKHPKKNLFFQYLDMTAWSGWRDTMWRRIWRKFMKLTSLTTAKL